MGTILDLIDEVQSFSMLSLLTWMELHFFVKKLVKLII